MFRLYAAALAAALTWAAVPSVAVSAEWEDEGADRGEVGETARGNGEVSVDLEAATPGLTPEIFRSTLSAYGDWYDSPRYGSVWRPRVAVGWRPYYYGSWLWTDEGWYWDSAEPFAWAAYHYGRWVFDPAWGWVWVPGYQWAPAWVTWRIGVDAIGWAPLGPGVSVFVTAYPYYDFWWTFVPCNQFVGVPVHRVAYQPRETNRWYHATAPAPPRTGTGPAPSRATRVTSAPAWGGPARSFIEERTGRPLVTERRAPAWRPGEGSMSDRERPASRERAAPLDGRGSATPAWPVRPDRGEERGRPEVRPGARGEAPRPQLGPPPRGQESRPAVRPAPRADEGRSQGWRSAPDRGDREERGRGKGGRER